MPLQLANYDVSPADARPAAARPRGAQEIDLAEAARRSGLSDRRLRQLCATHWLPAGLARLVNPAGGGKPQWVVWDYADPRLARVACPERVGTDLSNVPEPLRPEIYDRVDVLDAWARASGAAATLSIPVRKLAEQFCLSLQTAGIESPRGHRITLRLSPSQLYVWVAKRKAGGPIALADRRRFDEPGDGGAADAGELAYYYERLKFWYLTGRFSAQKSHECAAAEAHARALPAPTCSITGWRYLKKLPRQTVVLHREGKKAFTDHCAPFAARDYSALASDEIWCGDHHTFDVIVKVGQAVDSDTGEIKPRFARPTITAWEDLRSRRIVGYRIAAGAGNADTIIQAFHAACLANGNAIPRHVMIDNGKDYDSSKLQGVTKKQRRARFTPADLQRFGGVFGFLGVQVHHVKPFHGQSKPIERAFGTICRRFADGFGTYTGPSTAAKPEGLQERVDGAARWVGKADERRRVRGPSQAPDLAEFCAAFAEWLELDYHQRPHSGDAMDGRSPAAVYAACLPDPRPVATREQLLIACMPPHGPVTVHQNGVTYQGIDYGNTNHAVTDLLDQKVFLRIDGNDLSSVLVCRADGTPVGWAAMNRRLGVLANQEDVRSVLKENRETTRKYREYHQVRTRVADDRHTALMRAAVLRNEREAAAAAQQTGPVDPTPPPNMTPLRTPFDQEIHELAALRPAAGQEGMRIDQAVRPASAGHGDARSLLLGRPDAAPAAAGPGDGEGHDLLRLIGLRSLKETQP